MSRTRLVLAVALLLVGLLWIGQGLGMIGGTAMSGAPIWAVVGIALVIAAFLVARSGRRPAASS